MRVFYKQQYINYTWLSRSTYLEIGTAQARHLLTRKQTKLFLVINKTHTAPDSVAPLYLSIVLSDNPNEISSRAQIAKPPACRDKKKPAKCVCASTHRCVTILAPLPTSRVDELVDDV